MIKAKSIRFSGYVSIMLKDRGLQMRYRRWLWAAVVLLGLISGLCLALSTVSAAQDTELTSVQVVLLIDSSGSVAGVADSRDLSVRVARSLADYLQAGARTTPTVYALARATFAGRLINTVELRRLPDPIFAQELKVEAANDTDFVLPLRFARDQLRAQDAARKMAILLTDGEPGADREPLTGITLTNYFAAITPESLSGLIRELQADNVEVILLALGNKAPQYRQYWLPLIGENNYIPITPDSDLLSIFERLLWPPSLAPSARPQPLAQRAEFAVGPYLAEFTLSFLKSSPAISLTLTDPKGKSIPPVQGGDQATYYQVYEIKAPMPGTYIAAWQGIGTVRYWQQQEYWPAEVYLTPSQVMAGQPVTITARLLRNGVGVDAPLVAEIGRPGEITTTLPLLSAGEGQRSRVFWDTHDVGGYTIAIKIATADRPEVGRLIVSVRPCPTPVPAATPTATSALTATAVPTPTPTATSTFMVAPAVVTPMPTSPGSQIVGPSWESFWRGGLIIGLLVAWGAALYVMPKRRELLILRNTLDEFITYAQKIRERWDLLDPLEKDKAAKEAIAKITSGIAQINRVAYDHLRFFLLWITNKIYQLLDTLNDILRDPSRNSGPTWSGLADQTARDLLNLWQNNPRDVVLRNIYALLAAFCRPGSGYYSQIQDLLQGLSKGMPEMGISGDKLFKLYAEMLEDSWRSRANRATVRAKIDAILRLPIWNSFGPEGADWKAVYETFKEYSNRSSFVDAGQVPIPEFDGKVLTGVIYILRRIHGFPNGRDSNDESKKIMDMIEHLHEPERTILQVITQNW